MFELRLCHQLIHLTANPENEMQDLWASFFVFIGSGVPMDYSYLLKYEISKQLYSSEDSFLSPCRSEHSVGFYQPATSLKTLVFCPTRNNIKAV